MQIDPQAFEQYRHSPNDKTTLLRLILGTVIVVIAWTGATLITVSAGAYFHAVQLALFGNSRRISRDAFIKGFVAVVITSLVSEVLLYLLRPEIARGSISIGSWLLFLIPIGLLTFVQTSSEELLFRGYLPRGLAKLFKSPIIWGAVPLVVFTSLHWSPTTGPAMNLAGLGAIGAFAIVLMVLVYATGNLGAAFGAHLGNNLFGFLLISHQESYNAFALFTAAPLEGPGWGSTDALLVTAIGIIASALTLLLLVHPLSFLRVEADLPHAVVQGS